MAETRSKCQVRVLRLIEYIGDIDDVREQIASSLHGQRVGRGGCIIRATTIGQFPEIMETEIGF